MFILEAINDIGYFTISSYLSYTIAIITLPILFIRLLRAFPYYVKYGELGTRQNAIWNADDARSYKEIVRDFLVETHPGSISNDLMAVGLFILCMHLIWVVIPPIVLTVLIITGIIKFAKYMRAQHVKKQEFYATLKGE